MKAGHSWGKKTTLTKVYGSNWVQRDTVPASFKERQGLGDGSELWTEEG